MSDNPYAPPKSYVADPTVTLPDGNFIPGGRGVSPGRGWGWIADAWRFMGAQRFTFIGVVILYWLLLFVTSWIPFLGGIAIALFSPVVMGGLMLGFDAVRRGERLEVGHLFAGFQRHFGKLVAVGAISFGLGIVIAIVMIAILGASFGAMMLTGAEPNPEDLAGMGLTIVLAVLVALAISIPVYMFVWFAPPLIVLADLDVGTALKTSFSGCLRNIVPYIVWGLIALVLIIPATIPLFLGWLLLGPVLTVSVYTAYRDIFYET
jgi:uncharacterized membrane protein